MGASVATRVGVVGWEVRKPIGARDLDGARVAGRDVVERVSRGHGQGVGGARDGRIGEATGDEVVSGSRGDRDAPPANC